MHRRRLDTSAWSTCVGQTSRRINSNVFPGNSPATGRVRRALDDVWEERIMCCCDHRRGVLSHSNKGKKCASLRRKLVHSGRVLESWRVRELLQLFRVLESCYQVRWALGAVRKWPETVHRAGDKLLLIMCSPKTHVCSRQEVFAVVPHGRSAAGLPASN